MFMEVRTGSPVLSPGVSFDSRSHQGLRELFSNHSDPRAGTDLKTVEVVSSVRRLRSGRSIEMGFLGGAGSYAAEEPDQHHTTG
jgi:hypothetical protein